MASGKQTKLTGQIGEHLVSAMLGTKGYYATPYSGNVPGFDITAVHSESLKSFPIQVKTSNTNTLIHSTIDKWVDHHIKEGNYQHIGKLLKLQYPDMIWIMVRLENNEISTARYFICTEKQVQIKMVSIYKIFMKKHNYKRPGGGASTHSGLDVKHLEEFEDNWEILKNYH